MQTKSETEQAEQLVRQLRAVRAAVEQSQQSPGHNVQLREELKAQLAALEAQRDEIAGQLQNPMVSGSNRTGLSRRIEQLDSRIAKLDQEIAQVDAAIAGVAAPDVVVGVPPRDSRHEALNGPPEAIIALGTIFMLCVLLPLSIAYARRIWRRGAAVVTSIPAEINERLSRMDQNLDTIAVEVERIGEGQRFLTRVYAEQQGLPAGAAERVEAPHREKDWQRRGP